VSKQLTIIQIQLLCVVVLLSAILIQLSGR